MSTRFSSIDKPAKAVQWDLGLEKYNFLILWVLFIVNVILRGLIIPRLGAASFPNSDEHIFIELAKSFFYNHNFYSNGFSYIKQYNEILFPMILSPAYWFFSPENILTVLRSYGLVLMSLVVLPAYWLGWKVLGGKKQGLLVAFISVLIPEMTLVYTVAQEVIYYPLYLLALVLIYKKISGEKVSPVLLSLVFLLLWMTKAVGVTVFLAYGAYLAFNFVFYEKFKNIKVMIFQIVVIAILVIGLKEALTLGIRYLNSGSFAAVNDFYNTAMTKFLATSLSRLLSDIPNGILYYLFYCSIAFMVFPVVLVIDHFKQYSLVDRKFLIFLGLCFLATMGTVIILVYMDEGGAARELQRVHFRYFFPLLIPLIVMLLKVDFNKIKIGLPGLMLGIFFLFYEFIFRPRFQSGSVIDSKSLMLIERINNEIVNGFSIVFLSGAFVLIYFGFLIYKKLDGAQARNFTIAFLLLLLFVNQSYATYKTYIYYTVQTAAIERKNEYVDVSRMINSKPGTPILLFPFSSKVWFDVLISTQTNRDFSRADYYANILEYPYEPGYPPNFVITPKDLLVRSPIRNASRVNSEMKFFDMYQLNDLSKRKILLDYSLMNTYPDGWLKDNASLLISGEGRPNQISVTLTLTTSKYAPAIEASIKDSVGNVTTTLVSPDGTTLTLKVNKNEKEKNFTLKFGSNVFFVPKELPASAVGSDDTRELTYIVDQIMIH